MAIFNSYVKLPEGKWEISDVDIMGMHRLGACRSEVVFKNDGQPWYLGQLHVCWNSGPAQNYGYFYVH